MAAHPHPTRTRRPAAAHLAWAAVLNVPFLLCHPGRPVVDCPWLRCLVIGLVLFLVPGLPWVGVMIGRGWRDRFGWLWAVVASLAVMLAAVVAVHLAGWSLSGGTVWNVTWALTNVAMGLNVALGGPPGWGIGLRDRLFWLGGILFLAAHLLFFYGAVRVVPPLEDQDFEVLTCGYGMLARFEPLQATHRATCYQFSHPPLAYWSTAGSFLYFERLDYLRYYDAASRRARAARAGVDFKPFGGEVGGLMRGTCDHHRVIGREGPDYLVSPALNDGSRRIPVWLLENAVMVQYYERDPQKLAARTANVFLGALTVALLGCWIRRLSGSWTLAVLIPAAYATSPEIFVRSSYGGHFAGSNFAALLLLMAVERQSDRPGRAAWTDCFAAAGLLALVNQKLVLLPLAVVVWKLWQPSEGKTFGRLAGALLHPAAVGFAAGTAVFWLWGLSVDAGEFWQDHLRTHLFDRLAHHNPLGYGGYPGVAGLWIEFWQHTGYVLLPLGWATLAALVLQPRHQNTLAAREEPKGAGTDVARFSPGLWLLWAVLTAAVFSLVDWRQTKHLMPLLLPLLVAPGRWAAFHTLRRRLLAVALLGLTAWNLGTLCRLAGDFAGFPISPTW